ncbi:MAG: hypothetical protein R3C12_08400 [Planctomycetaceae bacterium]
MFVETVFLAGGEFRLNKQIAQFFKLQFDSADRTGQLAVFPLCNEIGHVLADRLLLPGKFRGKRRGRPSRHAAGTLQAVQLLGSLFELPGQQLNQFVAFIDLTFKFDGFHP